MILQLKKGYLDADYFQDKYRRRHSGALDGRVAATMRNND